MIRAGFWTCSIACLLTLYTCGPACAQGRDAELDELRTRLNELERQNAELRRMFADQVDDEVVGASSLVEELAAPPQDDAHIRSVIADYLAQEQAAEDAQQKAAEAEGYIVGSDKKMTVSWNHGFEAISKNKDFRVHVGGRYQLDTSWYGTTQNVQNNINIPYTEGIDLRRARLRADGTMYEVIEFATEYDFVNSARVRNAADTGTADFDVTAFTDVWWTFTKLPRLGNLRIGNQKEPIGFEHLVSSRYLPFIERSYNQDTFYGGVFNGFVPGIQAFNTYAEERGCVAVGVFKPTDNVFAYNNNSGDYSVVGRLTYLPWYVDEGRGLLHLGFSGRQASSTNDRLRFRTRDAIRSGVSATWPVPADTGTIFAESMQWLNAELVGVHGPWTFQSEYLVSFVDNARLAPAGFNFGNLTYHGGYAQLMYFITGESDHYNTKTGFFERVTPFENFFHTADSQGCHIRGKGAWQVGARYDYLDLNSGGINGGILHNGTLGLNWFLNPSMKIQFNYYATQRNAALAGDLGDGLIHGVGIRVAQDF